MSELTRFQDAFSAALAGADGALAPWVEPGGEAGLSVYRNTVVKGTIDALAANFPTVVRLVGEDWFRAAAREFTGDHAPTAPPMGAYGAAFPDWLAAFQPAAALPYLVAAARLDRLWTLAHLAADAEPLGPQALAGLDADALERTCARLHPSVGLAWFDDNSASLWLANRPPATPPDSFELAARPEGIWIVRPGLEVRSRRLDAGAFAFVAACAQGRPLAAAAALAAEQDGDLAAIIAACLEDGLFVALDRPGGSPP